jgi:hypothetical protein
MIGNEKKDKSRTMPKGVHLVQGVFWFTVVGRVAFLCGKLGGYLKDREFSLAFMVFSILIEAIILLGTYRKRSWVVPLMLYYSYFTLAWNFINVMAEKGQDYKTFVENFSGLTTALFCVYQIIVFSRSETKKFFREKGVTAMPN